MNLNTFIKMANSTTDKKLFSLREVIWFISLALMGAGIYFPMKSEIKTLKDNQTQLQSTLKENNLELINYKLNEIQEDFNKFSTKFDTFIDNFNEYSSSDRRRPN